MNTPFYIQRNGYLIASGAVADLASVDTMGGELFEGFPPNTLEWEPPPEKTYAQLRREAYPAIEELADALYWKAQGDASLLDKYLLDVAKIKAEFPKPSTPDI